MALIHFLEADPQSKEYLLLIRALDECEISYQVIERCEVRGRSRMVSCVDLRIEENDIAKAKMIYDETIKRTAGQAPSFCPKCDSENIAKEEKNCLWGLYRATIYRCLDCNHEL